MDDSYNIQQQINLQFQFQMQQQLQQQQQQQLSFSGNSSNLPYLAPSQSQYSSTPPQYINLFQSQSQNQQINFNQLIQKGARATPSNVSTILPPPPSLPPPPPPAHAPSIVTPTPSSPPHQLMPSPSGYLYQQQPPPPQFDSSYFYKNLIASQSNGGNYVNFALQPNQIDVANQSNLNSSLNNHNHQHLFLYSANNSFLNSTNNANNDTTSFYQNFQNNDQNQQSIDSTKNIMVSNTNGVNPYQIYNHHLHNMQYNHSVFNSQQYSPIKKQNPQYVSSTVNSKFTSIGQSQSFQQQKSKNSTDNNKINTTTLPTNLTLPKYVKPKICKSQMVIHVVNSKNISKPQPHMATSPPHNSYISNQSQSNENKHLPTRNSLLPPPPPPPTYEQRSSILTQKSNQLKLQPPPLPPPPPPPPPSTQTGLLSSPLLPPPPPVQRPISPPNTPPPIQRNQLQSQSTPHFNFNNRPAINNSLLNSLLNNSLTSTKNNSHYADFDASFNSSFNNSTNILNNSNGSNSTINNSVYTNANINSSTVNNNYHAMLISPNLRTLYDKKKPPPPYPGKQNNEIKMEIETNEDTSFNNNDNSLNIITSSTSSIQSNQPQSVIRYCSPQAFKFFMEQHAENILKHHKEREYRRLQLENEMTKVDLTPSVKEQMRLLLRQKETNYLRLRRAKMNKNMFEHIKILGLGAFGEVNLVRKRDHTQRLYAMKILHKTDVFNRNQAAHVKAERDILAEADNEWVVKLYYSFQDEENLYFVMDYVPGGDLMNLLIKLQIFSEELSRFYIGELTCAIESVHNLGFIHRDIKPDNILIDKNGHIKLTDFGLCTGFHWTHNSKYYRTNEPYNRLLEVTLSNANNNTVTNESSDKRLMAHSLVGTPNYIAPEILSRKGYTKSCDWWSVGVILYEMLVGEPPFRDDTPAATQIKVINWKKSLQIPDDCQLSESSKDLIFKLCTDAETRLGSEGIKAHGFFENFDFGPNLRKSRAPYVPEIKHPTDTSNFEPIDDKILAERKARIEEMHRNFQQFKLQEQQQERQKKLKELNKNVDDSHIIENKTTNRLGPQNISNRLNDKLATNNSFNNYTNNNPIMYEFAFRRFFDEAYTSDNCIRLNEDQTSLTATNTTTTINTSTITTSVITSNQDDKENQDNPSSYNPSSVTTSSATSSSPLYV